jgi:NAD(P) transhydrogenase subunit alpha
VPESVKKLVKAGHAVSIQAGAGEPAFYPDAEYRDAGATIEGDLGAMLGSADFVLKVAPPQTGDGGPNEVAMLRQGSMLLAGLVPTRNLPVVRALAEARVTSFSTDAIPRTTRAQAMDTLSSMANVAGYKGAILGALELHKYYPMFMTAAGTVFAAKVFVIGAGVAGLQAIATARRLGATVFATDVRPEVKEQIESVGGKYVGIELKQSAAAGGGYAKDLSEEDKAKQRGMLEEQFAVSDVVITTALIGGVFAPKLITAEMVERLKPGSVIVDLAADGGGNCVLSQPGRAIEHRGVKILAPLNLAATMPMHASLLWSRNLTNFILAFTKDGQFNLDLTDDILKGAAITHQGEILNAKVAEALQTAGARN